MLWRLIASVLAVSDTGSIALVSDAHDWPSQRACEQAIEKLYAVPREPQLIGGHRITMKVSASCQPVTP
jgi:hypothetical protein